MSPFADDVFLFVSLSHCVLEEIADKWDLDPHVQDKRHHPLPEYGGFLPPWWGLMV